ncbi:MAG: aspartyl protease family protein [Planctomycetia bacterium]|nr:aspartyl protease family protein [Planctomycetia bacterium]
MPDRLKKPKVVPIPTYAVEFERACRHRERATGKSPTVTHTTRRSGAVCKWTLRVWALIFAIAWPLQSWAADSDENVLATFNVARRGDALLVPVVLDGQSYQFLIDTGCTASAVDESLKHLLETTPRTVRAGGNARARVYRFIGTLGGHAALQVTSEAICVDLSRLSEAFGHKIDGILGMSILKSHIIQVDCDSGTLAFLRAVPKTAREALPLSYDRLERPIVHIELEPGEPVSFMVDTGLVGGAALVFRRFRFNGLVESGRVIPVGAPILEISLFKENRFQMGRLDHVVIGPFRHERIRVSEGTDNAVGLNLLSRYIATLDFPHDRLFLRQQEQSNATDEFYDTGITIIRTAGETIVAEVGPDSAAEAAGVEAGDRITMVNGKSASAGTLFELRGVLAGSEREVGLEIAGKKGTREITVRPRDNSVSKIRPTSRNLQEKD